MNDWIDIEEQLPSENQKVLIILKDTRGFNAVFKGGEFLVSNKKIKVEDVKYWIPRNSSLSPNRQIKKKCGMCGGFRR